MLYHNPVQIKSEFTFFSIFGILLSLSAHNNHAQRTDNILNNVRRNEDYISTNMKILPDRQHLNKSNILHWPRLSKHTRHISALILTAAIMLSFLLSLTGCGTGLTLTTPISVTDYKLNTYVQIDSYTGVNKSVLTDAIALCDYYEHIFSRTLSTSELYRVNNQETDTISDKLYELIQTGLEYSRLSDGAFDITIGSVSELWDFTTDTPSVPDDTLIKNALSYVDYTKVTLTTDSDGTHHISMPDGYCIDLGAVAKGYIADKIKAFLVDNGVKSAIINLGGNVLCIGEKKKGTDFTIAVKKPFSDSGEYMELLHINDTSVISSGTYERYFYSDDGTFYHHRLNPKTGYPYETQLCDVTILSHESTVGDCLSTTCFVLGADKGMELIESRDGIEAIFMLNDGSKLYSSGAKQYIQ